MISVFQKTFNGLKLELEYDLKNVNFRLDKLERLPVHKDLGHSDENIFNFILTEKNKAKYKNTVPTTNLSKSRIIIKNYFYGNAIKIIKYEVH